VKRVRLDWLEVTAACVAVLAIGIIYTVAIGFIHGGTAPVRTSSVQHLAVEHR
jgi:hypothetical protein